MLTQRYSKCMNYNTKKNKIEIDSQISFLVMTDIHVVPHIFLNIIYRYSTNTTQTVCTYMHTVCYISCKKGLNIPKRVIRIRTSKKDRQNKVKTKTN